MTLTRARILKADPRSAIAPPVHTASVARARRIAGQVIEARAEAARILDDAREAARDVVETASEKAAEEARSREVARLAASFLALRAEQARRAENDLDRLVELAVILAERLVGEALRVEPTRIAELAVTAIGEARGARQVRVEACPEDVEALEAAVGENAIAVSVEADAGLRRGSLVVHTDIGGVDARLEPQLARLGAALREALG